MMEYGRQNITLEMATQAGRIPVGFHVSAFIPTEVCLGSYLMPGKTFLTKNELSGQCSKCLRSFVFNVYTNEWFSPTTEK